MHPGEEILLSFACGEADLPQRALIEGHLGGCAACRATVGELTAAGGALLRAAEGEAPPAPLWDRVLERVEALTQGPAVNPTDRWHAGLPAAAKMRSGVPVPTTQTTQPAGLAAAPSPGKQRGASKRPDFPLPDAIRRELSDPGGHPLRWHWGFAPGIWYADLARDPATGSVLLGGYLPPGRSFPEHVHLGPETVLVLSGGYVDHLGRYEAGEYAVYPPGSSHRPATEPDEGCWSLIRLEKPNLLVGWRGWLQRLRR